MRKLLVGTALAAICAASDANADLLSLTFSGFGGGVTPAGFDLVTDFASGTGLNGTYSLVTGTTGNYHAPYFNATTPDPSQYLAVLGGDSVTLTLPGAPETEVAVYIGSWDTYNSIGFSNGLSYTGTQLASEAGVNPDYGSDDSTANGWLVFQFTPAEAVTTVTFGSTTNTLEVAAVASNVPEPATWAMMGLGFAGLGFAAFRRSAKTRAAMA